MASEPTESQSFDDGRVTTYRDDDRERAGGPGTPSIDPVCGMEVDPSNAETEQGEFRGRIYWFCSKECRATFDEAPERYAV